jgi:predicted outer membrane repeat protein
MSLFVFVVALALVHAQRPVVVTSLSQLTANVLAPNSAFLLSSTFSVNSSIEITGAANADADTNSVIWCSVLPCFSIDAANSQVRFANVIFRFTPPATVSSVLAVANVGHLILSNLNFRAEESQNTSLVQWATAAPARLTIRGLGSAAAPIDFQRLVASLSMTRIDAFVFEDSHGSCADSSHCITLFAAPGAVPTSTIALNNVHWRHNGTGTELIQASGSFAALSLSRSTTYSQLRVDGGATVRNITIKSCTMYGGIRARSMSLMHVSDVLFSLENFFKKSNITNVIDTFSTTETTLVVENVVARSRLGLGLHLLSMSNDTDSTVVVRNVTAIGFRGMFLCGQLSATSGLLRQLTIENVEMRGCKFAAYLHPLGVRNTSIANISVIDNLGDTNDIPYLVRTGPFEEIRVSNFSASGRFYGAAVFDGGSPNAVLSLRDIHISNASMILGVLARQSTGAVAQSYDVANFRVHDSEATQYILFTNASTSLTGLTLLNVTTGSSALVGDFSLINGVTVRGSLFNSSVGLVDSRIASSAQAVVWTNFDVQAAEYQSNLAVVRCPASARVNVTVSDWSVQDLVATASSRIILFVQNNVSDVVIDRFFASPFAGALWNNVSSQKFTLRNSVFDGTGFLIREHPNAANVVVVQNVTMTNGNCTSGQPALEFIDATSVSVSAFRVTGGTCMALEADRSNVTVVDSQFERINATNAVSVSTSNMTISGSVFRGMRETALISQRSPAIVLQNTLFEDNVATANGGAIRSTLETMEIVGSRFFKNYAQTDGGAIFAEALNVTRSLFRGNTAGDVGAAIFGDDVWISECDFVSNAARSVVFLRAPKLPVLIDNSSFYGNVIRTTDDTGVIQLASEKFAVRVTDSCLCNNTRAGFGCDTSVGSLLVDNTTVTEGATLRCPLTQFKPSKCTVAGCSAAAAGSNAIESSTAAGTGTGVGVTESASSAGLDGGTLGAIIGGCVGGVLIVGGIVAFVALRKRKSSRSATPATTPATPASEYGAVGPAIPLNAMSADYDLGGIPVIPATVYGNSGLAQQQADYAQGRLEPNP